MIFSNENAKIGGDRMTSDFMKELLSKDEKIKKGDVRGGDNVIY